jgi:hypothetical protein
MFMELSPYSNRIFRGTVPVFLSAKMELAHFSQADISVIISASSDRKKSRKSVADSNKNRSLALERKQHKRIILKRSKRIMWFNLLLI